MRTLLNLPAPLAHAWMVLVVLLLSGSIGSVATAAQPPTPVTETFTVQPEPGQPAEEIRLGYFNLALAPGEERTVRLRVTNTGAAAITLRNDPVEAVQIGDGGLDFTTLDKPVTGAGTWLNVQPERLTLEPGEAQTVTATVQVPAQLSPGDYVGGIAVQNERVQAGGGGDVLIDVHYRRVIAVLVSVPGERTVTLEVGGVSLSPAADGSQAQVELRNTGNVLVRGKGTLELAGEGQSSDPLAFTFGTLLPDAQASVPVALPGVRLQPGDYQARVNVESEDGLLLASWEGSAPYRSAPQVEPTAPREVAINPSQPLAPTIQEEVQEVPVLVWLLAGLLLLIVGIAAGVFLARRGGGRTSKPTGEGSDG